MITGSMLISSDIWKEDFIISDVWQDAEFAPVTADTILDIADELLSAILISLFTDQRFRYVDGDPMAGGDRRGWWGDNLTEENDFIGSKLWLLSRQVITDKTINKAKKYAKDALQWLHDDVVAEAVFIDVVKSDTTELSFTILIQKPGEPQENKYLIVWNNLENAIKGGAI